MIQDEFNDLLAYIRTLDPRYSQYVFYHPEFDAWFVSRRDLVYDSTVTWDSLHQTHLVVHGVSEDEIIDVDLTVIPPRGC